MSRAVVLVAGPDPFLDAFWLTNYATWKQHVDHLYVIVCGMRRDLRPYIRGKIEEQGGTVTFAPPMDHGFAIGQVIPKVIEDLILLMEEDAFVREPSIIDACFGYIEHGDGAGEVDVVGCPRATGTSEIMNLAYQRFGKLIAPSAEEGPLFWPTFCFVKRTDLLRTDGNYSVWGAVAGASLWGYTFEQDQAMDTFGWASLQLRENGARVHVESNYRVDWGKMDWWGLTQWFHVGSMSTGYGVYICGPRAHRDGLWASLRNEKLYDWCKRVAFWQIIAEHSTDLSDKLADYRTGIEELISEVGMSRDEIADWKTKLDRLVTW